jgi:hypothetical protein
MPLTYPMCDTSPTGDRRSLDDEDAQRDGGPWRGNPRLGNRSHLHNGHRATHLGKHSCSRGTKAPPMKGVYAPMKLTTPIDAGSSSTP